MSTPPSGTITYLFTDIEGSTRLLHDLGDRYAEVLAAHHRILRSAFDAFGGREIESHGDGFFAAFPRARDAVAASVAAQRAIAACSWPEGKMVRVRMGLDTGSLWTPRPDTWTSTSIGRLAFAQPDGAGRF